MPSGKFDLFFEFQILIVILESITEGPRRKDVGALDRVNSYLLMKKLTK